MITNRKNDIKHHELCKKASIYSYRKIGESMPNNCEFLKYFENKETGFYADILKNGDKIIIAYRGSDDFNDYWIDNDLAMSIASIPVQAVDALKAYDEVKRLYPNAEITPTGHSLGGSLAQIVAAIRGCAAVTFNAYGTKNMFKDPQHLKQGNIVNYVNENDAITMENGKNHLGTTYAVEHIGGYAHKAESMGDLSKRVERTPAELEKNYTRLHPRANKYVPPIKSALGVAMNAKNQMDNLKESAQNIRNSYEEKRRKDLSEFRHSKTHSECPGTYHVSGYTRSDGVKIDDYIRSCGAKHSK